MPKFRLLEKWVYKVEFQVEADSEQEAWDGDYKGMIEETGRDDGEWIETLEVRPVDAEATL